MTANIAQDMLSCVKVGILGALHKSAYNADGMGNVGKSFCKKEELSYKHPVESGVNRRSGGVFRKCRAFRKRSLGWSAILHTKLLENAKCICSLVHSEVDRIVLELHS